MFSCLSYILSVVTLPITFFLETRYLTFFLTVFIAFLQVLTPFFYLPIALYFRSYGCVCLVCLIILHGVYTCGYIISSTLLPAYVEPRACLVAFCGETISNQNPCARLISPKISNLHVREFTACCRVTDFGVFYGFIYFLTYYIDEQHVTILRLIIVLSYYAFLCNVSAEFLMAQVLFEYYSGANSEGSGTKLKPGSVGYAYSLTYPHNWSELRCCAIYDEFAPRKKCNCSRYVPSKKARVIKKHPSVLSSEIKSGSDYAAISMYHYLLMVHRVLSICGWGRGLMYFISSNFYRVFIFHVLFWLLVKFPYSELAYEYLVFWMTIFRNYLVGFGLLQAEL